MRSVLPLWARRLAALAAALAVMAGAGEMGTAGAAGEDAGAWRGAAFGEAGGTAGAAFGAAGDAGGEEGSGIAGDSDAGEAAWEVTEKGEDLAYAPPRTYSYTHKTVRTYDSETLKYQIEHFSIGGCEVFLSKVWVMEPAKQIRKATAEWKKNIMLPKHMTAKIAGAALAINGSGYWNPTYPDVPENYPGEVGDYFYTPWGSLTVTDGEVFRNLEGIPYCGLTLEGDGLHMYTGADNAEVLGNAPLQTWCFRDLCPMQRDGQVLTPEDWPFAGRKAKRTVIGRVDANNYLILSVSNEGRVGMTLHEINRFFQEHFEVEWLYNLDGGPSSALLARKKGSKRMSAIMGGTAKDVDMMVFIERPDSQEVDK